MPRVDFAKTFYQARSLPHAAQRLVNMFPEAGPADGKDRIVLYGCPGMKTWGSTGTDQARGACMMAGTLYTVFGSKLYSVTSAGVATQVPGVPIDGSGPVFMSTNGTQIVIVTDQTTGYVATTAAVTEIADTDFPGATSVGFLDGYHVYTRPDSDAFFVSNLNAGATISADDFASAESAPDNLVTVLIANRNVWLFGEDTTENWFNVGGSGFPFARRFTVEKGIAGRHAAVKADNTAFWLGNDRIVYRAEGPRPLRVSTHAIEEALRTATVSDAEAWTYVQGGHTFVGFTFPTAGLCFCYDPATNLWHERQSYGRTAWRAAFVIEAYGKILVGDREGDDIWELDLDTYTEAGGALQAIMAPPFLWADYARFTVHSYALDLETGVGLTTGQGSDPQIVMRYSKDGARTWSAELSRSMGAIGEYRTRVKWNRLGQAGAQGFVPEFVISDPVKRAVTGGYVEVEGNAV